jgi:hypothetical protein
LALVWAPPAFFVAHDLDRFVAVVLAPRIFFVNWPDESYAAAW